MTENPTLIQYLTWRRDEAQKYGPVDCEPFSYEDLSRMVDALAAQSNNVTPTQAQIDAAAKAVDKEWCEWQRTHSTAIWSNDLAERIAKAALTAAAEGK